MILQLQGTTICGHSNFWRPAADLNLVPRDHNVVVWTGSNNNHSRSNFREVDMMFKKSDRGLAYKDDPWKLKGFKKADENREYHPPLSLVYYSDSSKRILLIKIPDQVSSC